MGRHLKAGSSAGPTMLAVLGQQSQSQAQSPAFQVTVRSEAGPQSSQPWEGRLPSTDWMWRARLGAWHCCLTPLGCSPMPPASHTELLGAQDRSTPHPHPTPSAPLLHGPRSPSALEGLLCPLVPGSGDPRQVLGPYYWEGPGEPGPCAHSAQPGLGAGSPSAGEGLSELRERRPGAGPGLRRQGQDRAGIHGWQVAFCKGKLCRQKVI